MKPREEFKSCYFTFNGKLGNSNYIRTGLSESKSKYEYIFNAVIFTKQKKYTPEIRSDILKVLREDYTKEKFAKSKSLSLCIKDRILCIDISDHRLNFILENVIEIDDIVSYIDIECFNENKFIENCLNHYDNRMGYSTQRYKIEALRNIFETMLRNLVSSTIDDEYVKIKESDDITKDDVESLLENFDYNLHIIDVDNQSINTLFGQCRPKCITLLKFKSDDKIIYEICGKMISSINGETIQYELDYTRDDLFKFFD
jgi:hypothetical protein